MKARTAFFVAITVAALSPIPASARQATGQSVGSAIGYERRAEAIARVAEAAARRNAVAASVSITDNWWDARAGRQQYVQLRLEGFDKDLMGFDRLGIEPWPST
jgi:hypothetical protein